MTFKLPSSAPSRAHTFPWEILTHIFSYSDQTTLLSLCLVSFTVWEIARLLLYDEIELTSLRSAIRLLLTAVPSSSSRLPSLTTSPHHHRIGTLTVRLSVKPQLIYQPHSDQIVVGGHAYSLLLRHPPRPVRTLLVSDNTSHLIFANSFHRVLPTHVHFVNFSLHPLAARWSSYPFGGGTVESSRKLVKARSSLERSTNRGQSWTFIGTEESTGTDIIVPFSALWMRHHRRSLEIVFNFATKRENGYVAWRRGVPLEKILVDGGAKDENLSEGAVVVKVGVENEEEARKDVGELKLELRRKIRVEVV